MYIASVCPSGMIFIPCTKGVSHNETENAHPEDVAAGTRVLRSVSWTWPIADDSSHTRKDARLGRAF